MLRLKTKKKFLYKYFILLLVIAFSLTSCNIKKEKNNKTVKLNEVTRSIFYAPQYVALELGFFSDYGINVKLQSSEGSDKTMTALLSGGADIGLLGTSSILSVKSQGKQDCPVMFCQLTQKDGSFLVGREENFCWEDLKNREVIAGRLGGVPEMVFEHILRSKNLYGKVNLINNIKFDLMGIAFSRGIGDYVCLFEPMASILQKEKSFYILKFLGNECEKISYTGYCASKKYIEENHEVIQSFTNAIYKAQIWIENHSSSETAKLLLPYFVDCSEEILEKCIERYKFSDVWNKSPLIENEQFELLEDIMLDAGELKDKINFEDVIDNKFAIDSLK